MDETTMIVMIFALMAYVIWIWSTGRDNQPKL